MNTYQKYDVHYTISNGEMVYVDTVKARTEQEAADKVIKKYNYFNLQIQKVDLV